MIDNINVYVCNLFFFIVGCIMVCFFMFLYCMFFVLYFFGVVFIRNIEFLDNNLDWKLVMKKIEEF